MNQIPSLPALSGSSSSWSNQEDEARTWSRRIEQIEASLDALREPCEQSFLALGEALSSAHKTARAMGDSAAVLTDALTSRGLTDQARALELDLHVLDQALAAARTETGLQTIDDAAQAIGGSVQTLGKLLVQVRMLAMNARIEAAQLSGLGMDFTVFTREIGRLAQRGEQSIGIIVGTLRTLRDVLSQALNLQGALGDQHRLDLEGIKRRLHSAMNTLQQRQEAARRTLGSLPTHLDQAHRSVSEVVSALQIADMTRQRVEHVDEALATVLGVLNTQGSDQDMGGTRRHIMVNALCDLQARQLTVIRDDFEAKARIIETNLRALGTGVQGLREGVTRLHATSTEDRTDFLDTLANDLKTALSILERYRSARRETEDSMGTVVSMTSEIAEAVTAINEIDAEMHLIGLNASIKCGNLGSRGRVLTVIASELQAFARQTRALALEIGSRLDRIAACSSDLGRQNAGTDSGKLDDLDQAIQTFLDTLDRLTGESSERLNEVRAQTETLERSLNVTLTNFTIRKRMTEVFTTAARELGAIAQACRPDLTGPALDDARREVLEFLHKHYTMVDEREVHEAMFGGTPRAAAAVTPSKAATTDISDLLF
ncbi:methyl-accepting chemotaxis sensory transducer [Pararhodospirillum photometricum]|uniref:Methyl-accepting chemotaxis sensory transducer n=1 Tax=Pararhodospirillum photometricum DSM 122 TaxID=1150469 RepID=H6SP07_PARPM|nr:methyl-accepting chemotaxis sensory transducer [Pararhodospirillum photometricum]CCG07079.1 Methyl-accepting chemotaxis sensory transducer [Pararhodospirillum photometricum DSM 122]